MNLEEKKTHRTAYVLKDFLTWSFSSSKKMKSNLFRSAF